VSVKVSFDELLEESQREPVEIEMPGGKPIIVQFPTGEQSREIALALKADDEDAMILALFGDDAGKQLLDRFKTAPADFAGRLVGKVMESFGMSREMLTSGNSPASST
jgi:hypothetical protein